MAAVLDEYLAGNVSSLWRWGRLDCVFFAIDWVRRATGIDPAKRLRGSYADEAGAQAVMDREGGYLEMIRREMEVAGFKETDSPIDGDVAVVVAPIIPCGQLGQTMAIRSGGRWVAKSARGIRAGQFEFVCAWRVA